MSQLGKCALHGQAIYLTSSRGSQFHQPNANEISFERKVSPKAALRVSKNR
ncbi:hypothetical protein BS78_01G203700 [Paspalum vaginatum]|nr:hypothetical protein BS78_01G203700 [Paspalum vaginatum]